MGSRDHAKESVFDGNVKVKQGDLTLSCDKLVIIYDEKEARTSAESSGKKPTDTAIRSITASDNVKITQSERRATVEKSVWDYAKRTITLAGGPPRLWQGRGSFSGHRIIMRLDENYVAIDYGGAPDLMPRSQKKEK
jgi:lipopolysaccharide export system protein LptA